MKERLQKILAGAGFASRREAEGWIAAGRVTVNGRPALLGEQADPAVDRIEVDGRPIERTERRYYVLLYKPVGYVTSRRDPQGRPVVGELLKEIPARLFSVGRLDLTTEGLLLMTNDGALANRLAHPRHLVEKTYLVRLRGVAADADLKRLAAGIMLEDGPTAPARVEKVRTTGSHTWIEMTITEGRNRQVRRMCEAIGHPVSRLMRTRLAFLEVAGMRPGQWRHLTTQEVQRLKKL